MAQRTIEKSTLTPLSAEPVEVHTAKNYTKNVPESLSNSS